jgi:hypothetical protein
MLTNPIFYPEGTAMRRRVDAEVPQASCTPGDES